MFKNQLYSAEQSRELDQVAIHEFKIAGALLMQRAGYSIFENIPKTSKNIVVFIGAGNNGGDGSVAAFFAKQAGLNVTVVYLGELSDIKNDAKIMLSHAINLGVEYQKYDQNYAIPPTTDVIVDALLGTGLNKPVSGEYLSAINMINSAKKYVISADIPSGICANTGSVLGCAIKANTTCTFIGYKKGLFTSDATDHVGELILNNLLVPESVYEKVYSNVEKLDMTILESNMLPREQNTSKGVYGNLVVIAGDKGMPGAALMNCMAALKIGAGKVNLITHPEHSNIICANAPEIMSHGLVDENEILRYCQSATAILIGSGTSLGCEWSEKVFEIIKKVNKPIIADAGILDFLKTNKLDSNHLVITPHPGEAGRMLNLSPNEINQDRFLHVSQLAEKYNCIAVLKGKGTLIKSKDEAKIYLCPYGNPLMASAGMGDVLAGMIAGLSVQGYSLLDTAQIGVAKHSYIADQLVYAKGKKYLIASDIYHNL